MSNPTVRRAQQSDQAAVGALWEQLLHEQAEADDRIGVADDARERWENDFPVWLNDETARLFVAETDDGEIAGFVSARRWGPAPIYEDRPEIYLDELFVRPADRRQGVGTHLVEAVCNWRDEVGAERVRLRALAENEEARAFWAKQEAVPLSVTLTIEGDGAGSGDTSTPDEGSKKIGF